MIAKQKRHVAGGVNYDSIEWRTADPVTGTVARFDHASGGLAMTVENYEPLGQRLYPNDPEDYEPPTGSFGLNNADYPEWMCEEATAAFIWGDFAARPWACQRKYVGGEDRYGRYSTTYRIESPQKVGRVFYPAGHAPAGSDTGLAYAARQLRQDTITATAKDDSPGTCDWDKDGRPNCSVSVNPSSIDLSDTGWTEPPLLGDVSEQYGGGGPGSVSESNARQDGNPCDRMARRAQRVANEAIEWAKKNNLTWKDALSMFDRSFTPYYIGQIWTGTLENLRYYRSTGGGVPLSKRLPGEYGQQDFRDEYLDQNATRYQPATDNRGNPMFNFESDQVHHFVGLFSAGINGAYWSSTAQDFRDRWDDNPGDIALSDAAYRIGQNLAKDPENGLARIGTTIRSEICR